MSELGVAQILARLEAMERDHAEDMAALGARLDILARAHSTCAKRCWVANQEQMLEALRRSSSNLPAIPELR